MIKRLPSLLLALLLPIASFAQWHSLPGPYGGGAYDFAGTGNNGGSIYAATPNGVYHSADDARTWSAAGLQGIEVLHVIQYVISGTPEALLAATSGDVYFSADNGMTWRKAFTATGYRIEALLQSNLDILVGVSGEDSVNAGIYRSTDGGTNWSKIVTPSSLNALNDLVVSGPYLVAATETAIWRSPVNGSNWSKTSYPYGVIHTPLALRTAGQDVFAGAVGGLYISTDNGANWLVPNNAGIDTANDDFATFAINLDTIVAAGSTGVFYSKDGARSWQSLARMGGYPAAYETIGMSYLNSKFISGARAGILTSSKGDVWSYAADSERAANVLDIAVQGTSLFAITERGVARSTDRGQSWSEPATGSDLRDSLAAQFLSVNDTIYAAGNGFWRWDGSVWKTLSDLPIQFVATDSTYLYGTLGTSGVARSTDGGNEWKTVSTGLPVDSTFTDIVFGTSSESSAGPKIFAVIERGNPSLPWRLPIFSSTDRGETWSFQDSLATSGHATSCAITPFGFFIGTTAGLFRSTDAGIHWDRDASVPADVSIQFLKLIGQRLFAGFSASGSITDGLYASSDGNKWDSLSSAVPSVVTGIASDSSYTYIGTSRSSVWQTNSSFLGVKTERTLTSGPPLALYPNPCNEKAIVSFEVPEREHVMLRLFDNRGILAATLFDGAASTGILTLPFNSESLASGSYLMVLTSEKGTSVSNLIIER